MEKKILKIKIRPVKINIPLFFLGFLFFFYYFKKTAIISSSNDMVNMINHIEDCIYFICLIYMVLENKYKPRQILFIGIVGIAFFLIAAVSSYAELLKCLFLVTFAKNVSFEKICRIFAYVLIFLMVITMAMFILGISVSPVQRRNAIALGFNQANAVSVVLMMITFLILATQRISSIKVKLILFTMNLSGYFLSDGRAGFGLSVLGIILTNEKIYKILHKKIVRKSIPFTVLAYTALSLITAYLYPVSKFIQKINLIVTHRIDLNYRNLSLNKLKLLGQKIELFTTDIEYYNPVTDTFSTYNTVDNAYVSGLIQMGIMAMIIVFVINILLTYKIYKKNHPQLLIIQLLILTYGLFESSIFSIYISFVFLYLITKFRIEKIEDKFVIWE